MALRRTQLPQELSSGKGGHLLEDIASPQSADKAAPHIALKVTRERDEVDSKSRGGICASRSTV